MVKRLFGQLFQIGDPSIYDFSDLQVFGKVVEKLTSLKEQLSDGEMWLGEFLMMEALE